MEPEEDVNPLRPQYLDDIIHNLQEAINSYKEGDPLGSKDVYNKAEEDLALYKHLFSESEETEVVRYMDILICEMELQKARDHVPLEHNLFGVKSHLATAVTKARNANYLPEIYERGFKILTQAYTTRIEDLFTKGLHSNEDHEFEEAEQFLERSKELQTELDILNRRFFVTPLTAMVEKAEALEASLEESKKK